MTNLVLDRKPECVKRTIVRAQVQLAAAAGQPAAQPPDSAKTIQTLRRELAGQKHLLADWAGLTRYGSQNTEVRPPSPGENRVVFLGDDITERWGQAWGQAGGQAGGQSGGKARGREARASSPANRISTAASAARPQRKCWSASARM